jgi:hypothetical protein
MKIRTYSELCKLETIEERYEYLKLGSKVGEETFGFERWLNQTFYRSKEWREIRDEVIIRDNGCEFGLEGYEIDGGIIVHHMNPITKEDILHNFEEVINPEYLISCSSLTHKAIHYGSKDLLPQDPVVRRKNDTCPWRHD